MDKKQILIVEDEPKIATLLADPPNGALPVRAAQIRREVFGLQEGEP